MPRQDAATGTDADTTALSAVPDPYRPPAAAVAVPQPAAWHSPLRSVLRVVAWAGLLLVTITVSVVGPVLSFGVTACVGFNVSCLAAKGMRTAVVVLAAALVYAGFLRGTPHRGFVHCLALFLLVQGSFLAAGIGRGNWELPAMHLAGLLVALLAGRLWARRRPNTP